MDQDVAKNGHEKASPGAVVYDSPRRFGVTLFA